VLLSTTVRGLDSGASWAVCEQVRHAERRTLERAGASRAWRISRRFLWRGTSLALLFRLLLEIAKRM
jgi:hypothetical protein